MFTATSSSKRRRIQHCPLYDLLQGGGLLEEVAKYLAPPSRIMFSLAVTPPQSPYDTIMARSNLSKKVSSSIAGSDWDTLDFGDIEKELASRLSDNDMCAILVHIDAARKVKRLMLTNCTNITGIGLRPLLFSTTIEQIDLSLVGLHQKPKLDPKPPISCEHVLPILDSIISGAGASSLKHIQFPYKWLYEYGVVENLEFKAFLGRFRNNSDTTLNEISCSVCSRKSLPRITGDEDDLEYGLVSNMCCVCLRLDCKSCIRNRGVHFCSACERNHCTECTAMVQCGGCEQHLCMDCSPHTHNCDNPNCTEILCDHCAYGDCNECKRNWCSTCWEDDAVDTALRCQGCRERACCGECSAKEEVQNGVHRCMSCDEIRCDNCRIKECQGNNNCRSCMKIVAPLLLEQTMEQNRQLKNEVAYLKGKIELSASKITELSDKLSGIQGELSSAVTSMLKR